MQRTLARVTGDMHAERGGRLCGTRTRKSLYELKGEPMSKRTGGRQEGRQTGAGRNSRTTLRQGGPQ